MIRYRIVIPDGRTVTVSIDVSGPNDAGPILFEGLGLDVRDVKRRLLSSHGLDGHLVDEETTPVDLDLALRGQFFDGFDRELVEGQAILDRFERKLVR